MKLITTLLLLFLSLSVMSQTTFRIAFGSCSDQTKDDQLWTYIVKSRPDIWVWGGDNIYGDTTSLEVLQSKYNQQKNRRDYQQLLATCPVTGTWDDHDYGINDGGKNFSIKKESKKLAAEFLGLGMKNPVWEHEGLYNSTLVNKSNVSIKIINLDTRYFRDTVYKEYFADTLTGQRTYRFTANPQGDILGEDQWRWLEDELKNSTAALHIINSSIQVVASQHRFEKWANLPLARKRLFDLLARYRHKKVIIISGDRHIAELSKIDLPGLPYPLFDFTSSGLTHTWDMSCEEKNQYRTGELIVQKSFGHIELTIDKKKTTAIFSVMGKDGAVYQTIKTEL